MQSFKKTFYCFQDKNKVFNPTSSLQKATVEKQETFEVLVKTFGVSKLWSSAFCWLKLPKLTLQYVH